MHEYLHKYFENNKKLEIFSILNMRPLSNVSPPPAGGTGRGVLPSALLVNGHSLTTYFLSYWSVYT